MAERRASVALQAARAVILLVFSVLAVVFAVRQQVLAAVVMVAGAGGAGTALLRRQALSDTDREMMRWKLKLAGFFLAVAAVGLVVAALA